MGKKQRIWITAMMHWEKMHEFCNHRKNIALEIILSIKKNLFKINQGTSFSKNIICIVFKELLYSIRTWNPCTLIGINCKRKVLSCNIDYV